MIIIVMYLCSLDVPIVLEALIFGGLYSKEIARIISGISVASYFKVVCYMGYLLQEVVVI